MSWSTKLVGGGVYSGLDSNILTITLRKYISSMIQTIACTILIKVKIELKLSYVGECLLEGTPMLGHRQVT